MYDHPIVKAAIKLCGEVKLPEILQNKVLIAASFLAKRDKLLPADIERLALIQFMYRQNQNAADRMSLDKVRLDYGEWRITLFKDAPLDEWRIEITDGEVMGVVRSRAGERPTMSLWLVKDELAPDDPSIAL